MDINYSLGTGFINTYADAPPSGFLPADSLDDVEKSTTNRWDYLHIYIYNYIYIHIAGIIAGRFFSVT